jgi:transcriptional regulator with XRE-family HTH domain
MKLRVIEICKNVGITQKALAEKIEMSPVGLSKSINGNPTIETLEKIANALNVDISELFDEKEPIFGVLIFNGNTYRIDSFSTLNAFFRDYADYLNLGKEEEEKE